MEHWAQGAKAFIGPEIHCRTEATMAAAQNLPLISFKCMDEKVSDKAKFVSFFTFFTDYIYKFVIFEDLV